MSDRIDQSVLPFWQAIEALSPQPLPKAAPGDHEHLVFALDQPGAEPPWLDPAFLDRPRPSRRNPNKPEPSWLFIVYLGVYPTNKLIDLLEDKIGRKANTYEERPGGESCLAAVAVDSNGVPMPESFVISLCAWTTGAILSRSLPAVRDVDKFQTKQEELRKSFAERMANRTKPGPLNREDLNDLVSWVAGALGVNALLGNCRAIRISGQLVDPAKIIDSQTDGLINSFFIEDLLRLGAIPESGLGDGLRRYLSRTPVDRLDLRANTDAAFRFIDPQRFPQGRWPSLHALVFSQQIAANAILEALAAKPGIFAINGPPGTGKTTLLREIVAQVVVDRAIALYEFRKPTDAFARSNIIHIGKFSRRYYPLPEPLSRQGIVVASSNNGAVENVSLELPRANAIDDRWADSVDYFRDIASLVLGEPAWALLSARLGAKSNRTIFASRFWFKQPNNKDQHDDRAGLKHHLDAIQSGTARSASWDEARGRFDEAIRNERRIRDTLSRAATLPATLEQHRQRCASVENVIARLQQEQGETLTRVEQRERQAAVAASRLADAETALSRWVAAKPGIWEQITTLGRAHRDWRQEFVARIHIRDTAQNIASRSQEALGKDRHLLAGQERQIRERQIDLSKFNEAHNALKAQLRAHRDTIGAVWPDPDLPDEDRERAAFWSTHEWTDARTEVFLAALALHRAFIENAVTEMLCNLNLAVDMLAGKLPIENALAWRTAFDTLTLVVPVVSTTFAALPRMLAGMGQGSIGWLLIDEAGQAVPQAAAGAIWRASRTVVVGDPLQLEPISTVPATVEGALGETLGADVWWYPSRTSVQVIADHGTPLGTFLRDSAGHPLWVGSPLRVHRRCDEPMFGISNDVAYNGLMVHCKSPSASTLPPSCWIDVRGAVADGHWIAEEGDAARQVIIDLLDGHGMNPADIILISPFRDVVRRLRRMGRDFGLDPKRVGTIHTAQGKEAEAVLLVLGGHPERPGAKDWAAEKPNLLNVAASRAKERLYVVGNRLEWVKRRHFSLAAARLPVLDMAADGEHDIQNFEHTHNA